MTEEKQMTLENYNKLILKPLVDKYVHKYASSRDLDITDYLLNVFPLTRWQRFKYKLTDLKQRCKDIWTIISGGDVHRNCGY